MIEVENLVKKFDSLLAVDDVSFSVPRGQVLGFLGPNGAGKSTTMKMLTGFITPTSGTATVGGKDITKDSIAVRQQIGYLPESAPSYGEMTVCEFLEFIAEMRGFRKKARIAAAEKMREVCFLSQVWHQPIETLSKGFRQRVGFAQSLIHDPPVLILDEPTDGLDPNQKHEVRQLIRGMAADKTIILSTHILEEVEEICERVVIIAQGKIVADAAPESLKTQSVLHNAVTIRLAANKLGPARDYLATISDFARIESIDTDTAIRVYPREGRTIVDSVAKIAREQNWPLEQLTVERGRLDEVFRKVTTRGV